MRIVAVHETPADKMAKLLTALAARSPMARR